MAQIFAPSSNTLIRLAILGAAFGGLGLVSLGFMLQNSPYVTKVDMIVDQNVPFSHEHHVRGLGIDCRYCHTSVEEEAYAGIPPTYTCMSCHSQVWNESPMLAPVRESLAENKPLTWRKVHDLPDFVYFHHGIHVQKGVGCATCHGQVDEMPLMWKDQPMTMQWCLNCHRNPEQFLRPADEVFNLNWTASDEGEGVTQESLGAQLVKEHNIPKDRLTNCSVCHR